jgi:uncharacterized protein (DUF2141 family)
MESRLRVVPCLAIAWLLSTSQLDSSGALSLHVSPRVAREPARITVRVSVEPNAGNRALEVVAESATFFRSSYLQLDGDRAARTSVFQYRDLPAGDYAVHAVLLDAEGGREGLAVVTVRIRP